MEKITREKVRKEMTTLVDQMMKKHQISKIEALFRIRKFLKQKPKESEIENVKSTPGNANN
jgi:hypothetical protein